MTALDMVAPYQVNWRPPAPQGRKRVPPTSTSAAGAAPLASRVTLTDVLCGDYQISAVLADGAGRQRAIVRQSVNVIAMAGSHW